MSPDERNTEKSGSSAVTVQRFPGNRTVARVNCELVGDVTLAMQRCVIDELKRSPELVLIDLSTATRVGGDGVDQVASVTAIAGESDIPSVWWPRAAVRFRLHWPRCSDRAV